ncbi:hypothetical protein K5V21_08200 [Clostridium sardiniense]|uniref:Uncharacterized protein n=1 Tax=Clostridium sardiniense TaxID=29369 RepID=A0ABS7KXZ6_CLOSR|nr:hypothetical protein [Clostridium sardiniense]MBY0755437.1 hypothetical protein [Clostridium sardiniense]MDQ0461575.1 hypothetical protein [Clostridium sardiniense]
MKNFIKKLSLLTLILSFTLLFNSITTFAENINTDINTIKKVYDEGVKKGKVDPNNYTFNAFEENYKLGIDTYDSMKNTVGQGLNYNEWFDQVLNFGAFPDGEGHAPSEKKRPRRVKRSQEDNAMKFECDLRKGDIIVVLGGVGHAAIATTDNYILEMTGGGNALNWIITGIKNNNNQFHKSIWLRGGLEEGQGVVSDRWIDKWIQIWRIPDRNMANKCANYADRTFWNSTGGYRKNIHIDYRITSKLTTKNPSYCSKLVFQSYYWGSGSAPVIKPNMVNLTSILPNALPNVFTGKYAPYKVGTY